MERVINNFGNSLEEYVRKNDEKNACKLIKFIRKYLDENVGGATLNFLVSKVFNEPYNLPKFLVNISSKKEWKSTLSDGIKLLSYFLHNFFDKLRPYATEICTTCKNVALSKANAYTKSDAIDTLCFILNSDCEISLEDVKDIYNTFYSFCKVQANTSASVRKSVFIMLGAITSKYPSEIADQKSIIDLYISQLKHQADASEKSRDKNIVRGCITGLSDILDYFSLDQSSYSRAQLYEIIKKLCRFDSTTFDVRDVLTFISKHCGLFGENMYNDSPEMWHQKFLSWLLKTGENVKAGYAALEAFYSEIAIVLQSQLDERGRSIFQYFYNYFLLKMKDEKAQILEIRLAIRGFGVFSGPCESHLTKIQRSQMFIIVVNRMEQDYFVNENPTLEQLEYLPDYIHCFSSILHQIGEYNFEQINSLQQISVLMIKTFPRLSPIHHNSVFDSLKLAMYYLYMYNPKSLELYLQRVVYQGVLWTCSHRTTFDVDLLKDDSNKDKFITYKNYLTLWKNFLSISHKTSNNFANISMDVRKSVVSLVYDELMKTVLLLIEKLNFEIKSKYAKDIPIVDPQTSYEAEKIDDFIVFINVVDFYTDLLSNYDPNRFRKWVKIYTKQIIAKSTKYPLVSGFYKLLKLGLQISDKIDYFEESKLKKESKKVSYQIIFSFLENVSRMVQEFKDDLQISCLQLLLTVPVSFVEPLLPIMPSVFYMVLTIGRGYLKLAENAVDTLEKWYKVILAEKLKSLLQNVLPHLDPFLRSQGFSGDPDVKSSALQGKKGKQNRSKRKIYVERDSELATLQQKILMFIGQLDFELCMYMIECNKKVESVTWDKQPQLKFTVPYSEVKPCIYLDKMIPRIIELALSSGDQKTRITACELLHAVVIFMLGSARQMSVTKSKQLSKLFKKLIMPLIQLGCDSNDVVRQLFSPLLFQMIHWYSSPMQLMSAETSILLDTLMEGVSHQNDTAVRDICGKCIKEFVRWSIKQSSKEDLANYSHNIKSIIQKLCLYFVHPNSFKRLGAALAFNNIYVDVREEEAMVNIYWIELFYSMLISMSLENFTHKSYNNLQIDSALNHMQRVFVEKKILFNTNDPSRRVPSGIDGPLIQNVVFWVVQQTGSLNTIYRRKCIKLLCSLAPYVNGCAITKDFITKHVETRNEKWFLQIYESDGIGLMPTLESWEKFGSSEVVLKWLQFLLRCLDAHKFFFDYNIIAFCKLNNESKLYTSLKYFIEFISPRKLNDSLALFEKFDEKDAVISPHETENYNTQKCAIIHGILDYLSAVMDRCTTWCDELCSENFWNFFCCCVFHPDILGFDLLSENTEVLSKSIVNLFNKFAKKLPEMHLKNFAHALVTYFQKKIDINVNLNSSHVHVSQRQLLKGLLLLEKTELVQYTSFSDVIPKYFTNAVLNIFNCLSNDSGGAKMGVILQSPVQEYAELQLKLLLLLNDQMSQTNTLCECLINNEQIKHPESYTNVAHGQFFMESFKNVINEYAVAHFSEICKELLPKWTTFNNINPLNIIINILKYLLDSRNTQVDTAELLPYCHRLFNTSEDVSLKDRNFQIEFMTHVIRVNNKRNYVIGSSFPYFKSWFLEQLLYEPADQTPKNVLQFKCSVLSFLHCVTGPEDDEDFALQSALTTFRTKIFQASSECLDNADFIVLFKKLLDYLILSRSRIVLQCVAHIFTRIKYDEKDINTDKALQMYLSRISPDQQYKSMNIIHSFCCDRNIDDSSRYKIAKVFLVTILRECDYSAFEEFFVQNIKTIIQKLKVPIQSDISNILVDRSINLMLVEVMFSRINIVGFTDKTCVITKAAFDGNVSTGRELLTELTKIVKTIRKEKLETEDVNIREFYRLYHCNAFNALVSLFSNTKKSPNDIKIYSYLFYEDKQNGECIWKNVLDCTQKIEMSEDFDALPARKKIFVNIRRERRPKTEANVRYIESQSLFNSTLSEDICKFDFTNTIVRTIDPNQDVRVNENNSSVRTIIVENIDMNNHECMGTICELIRHLIENGISPLPENINEAVLPSWLDIIRKLMLNSDTEVNVRIFFGRVMHNMTNIFMYYAKFLFEPVIQVIVDNCAGDTINYFVADLVKMLIIWSENLDLSEQKPFIVKLLSFLMKNAHNDRKDMLKYNLEIIKTSVETWKTVIEIPHEILYDIINSKQHLAGVHLASIFLANGFIPWTNSNSSNFFEAVILILKKEDKKVIYLPVAELLGMILSKADSETDFKTLHSTLESVLNTFKDDKLFYSIEHIQMHYPVIIDKFIRKFTFLMHKEKDAVKCICLKNILRRYENLECQPLNSKELVEYLNSDDQDIRLLTLHLINKSVSDLKKANLISVISAVAEQKFDQNEIIRNAVYDVLITAYKKFSKENDTDSQELMKICKPVLLLALIDSDVELQEKIQNFWYNEQYKSLGLCERYEKSLKDLYAPEIESYYLGCVVYFLLQACKTTPEYNKLMFEHPLSECKFDEYKLLINWRAQNASMAPMFANTLATNIGHLDRAVPELIGVRESVSAKEFVSTPSTLDMNSSLKSPSSFLFSTTSNAFLNMRSGYESRNVNTNILDDQKFDQRSRRFLKDRYKISLGFAKYEVEKKYEREQQKRDKIKRKEANVVLYREYRKGELPDIQIPHSAIIAPLQILVRRDGVLARQLYATLFNGLINEMENCNQFISNFNDGIISVFNQTCIYVPNMIGAFLDVSFENNKKKNIKKINISPDTVSTVCKNSGLLPIGCLLLEEYISNSDELPTSSKRGCGDNNVSINYWVKLADMYKELNEWDAVLGIFSSKHMEDSEDISSAIHFESTGHWREALSKYKSLINADKTFTRRDFYYESYFKCYANLSEWKNLSQEVQQVTEKAFWDGEWNQENMLPWYITAEVCLALEESSDSTILSSLSDWMKDKEKSEYIKDRFSGELAACALLQNDTNVSKHYLQNSFSKFLEAWAHQNPLFSKIRSNKLLNFQKIVDLNKYLTLTDTEDIINYWERNSDLNSYSVSVSEIRTLYRTLLVKVLERKLTSQEDCLDEFQMQMKQLLLLFDLNLINNSLDKNNYFLARKYCKKNRDYFETNEENVDKFKLSLAVGKIGMLLAEAQTNENAKLRTLVECWKKLETESKSCSNTYIDLQIELKKQIYKTSQNVLSILNKKENLLTLQRKEISSLLGYEVNSKESVQDYSLNTLRNAIDMGEFALERNDNTKIRQSLIDTYMTLILFIQNHENVEIYYEDVIKYVLRTMKLGSKDGRQLFPCLLQIPELEGFAHVFQSESEAVPTWTFLLWIPQLLASLHTPSVHAVANLVERIATVYPQAIIYDYTFTREKYDVNCDNEFLTALINKLDNILHNELVEKFLHELSCVCIPELYLNYHLEKMIKNINNDSKSDLKEVVSVLKKNIEAKCNSSKHFKPIEDMLKTLEQEINQNTNVSEVKNYISKMQNNNSVLVRNSTHLGSKYSKLKRCSLWLADFQASNFSYELEIPGQYTGHSKPLVRYHTKISSFHSKISVKPSLRKPFQITIFGSDAKEYSFLIKFGEDLRQDQRIQQLFSLANNILNSDPQCKQRNLSIEQYQVIPLKTSLGLIKIVDNTKSLKEFIYSAEDDEKSKQAYENVQTKYIDWIKNVQKLPEGRDAMYLYYARACMVYSKEETERKFTELIYSIPADVLSKAFWSISIDAESYTYLRHQFITSYATMSLVHWLLGIGDRNLGNCLVLQNTGRAVGIDFGYAFGAATQHLPIPELIPFRLSPHILYLMEPLRETGFVEHSMIHSLRALRKQKHILLSTMNVFIKEPSVDWLEFAKSQEAELGTSSSEWYPNQKVSFARRKLEGANPMCITKEEVELGCIKGVPQVLEAYIKILKGDDSNIRSKMPPKDLTEEEQVQCLLDQATDYNILGHMFAGLELWI